MNKNKKEWKRKRNKHRKDKEKKINSKLNNLRTNIKKGKANSDAVEL